eukprot:9650486-Lingulodinium_polyedra.AAC.1
MSLAIIVTFQHHSRKPPRRAGRVEVEQNLLWEAQTAGQGVAGRLEATLGTLACSDVRHRGLGTAAVRGRRVC